MRDEILESVRESFASVHMGRPLEAIEARGRARRRHRQLAGLGGISLSVGLGLALVLTTADPGVRRDGIVSEPAGIASQAGQRMELASFALERTAEGTITVTFKEAAADPKALEKALADVGIAALVRVNERCAGNRAVVPDGVVRLNGDSGNGRTLTITAAALPKNVTLSLNLGVDDRKFVRVVGIDFSVTGSPVICGPVTVVT